MSTVDIRRSKAIDLIPDSDPNYKDIGLLTILDKLAFKSALIMKGPKGAGKTLAIQEFAARNGYPIIRHDCTEDTSTRDFIGSFAAQGKSIFYALGAITTAIEVANEMGGAILILEEINSLSPGAQKMLNPIADYRQEISVAKIGKIFKVGPGKKIWVIGTMNPNYSGTYSLNEDLRSRFAIFEVGYMKEDDEKDLLTTHLKNLREIEKLSSADTKVINGIMSLAQETRGNEMGYALSTRDLIRFLDNYYTFDSVDKPLKILEGKYDNDYLEALRARVASAMKCDLSTVTLF